MATEELKTEKSTETEPPGWLMFLTIIGLALFIWGFVRMFTVGFAPGLLMFIWGFALMGASGAVMNTGKTPGSLIALVAICIVPFFIVPFTSFSRGGDGGSGLGVVWKSTAAYDGGWVIVDYMDYLTSGSRTVTAFVDKYCESRGKTANHTPRPVPPIFTNRKSAKFFCE